VYVTTYNPLPVAFTHGEGVWLYANQEPYLDALSGIAVCNLGHAHPHVTRAIQEQAAKLIHTSNTFHIPLQEELAARLTKLTHMEQVFFSNSGAEANEAALKLIRLFGHQKGIESPATIVMTGAFHGRTLGTLSASGGRKLQAGFEPLVGGFVRAPFNDIEAIRVIAKNRNDIAAVMLEPIQGEGGVIVAQETYLRELAEICDANDWLLVMDEVQTGNGRTGALYACMGLGLRPDILTTAKGLANGVPIGATLMSGRAVNLFKPGTHGSTFGGNPLACAAAGAVLDVIEQENLCEHVRLLGIKFKESLLDALGSHPHVRQIRGRGLMIGIEMDKPCLDIRLVGLKHRLLFSVTAESVIRLLPPLILQESEMELLVERLVQTIDEYYA
jgi:acetylornithine/N-succinyldiaminopimelate aminotransferase